MRRYGIIAGLLVITGCGAGGDNVAPSQTATSGQGVGPTAVEIVDAACAADAAHPVCRDAFAGLVGVTDSDATAALERWLGAVCAAEVDATCMNAAGHLIAAGRYEAVAELVASEADSAAAVVAALDAETAATLIDRWCGSFPAPPVCEPFLDARADAGDAAAADRRKLLELRRLVAEIAEDSNRSSDLLIFASQAEDGIRLLAELAAHGPSMGVGDRDLVVAAIAAAGDAAYPTLISLIEHGDMEEGLVAAVAGWDPDEHESEDDARPIDEPRRTLALDEAVNHIGRQLTIFHRDGTRREGILKRIDGDVLYVEVNLGGGTMTMKINRSDVARIAF